MNRSNMSFDEMEKNFDIAFYKVGRGSAFPIINEIKVPENICFKFGFRAFKEQVIFDCCEIYDKNEKDRNKFNDIKKDHPELVKEDKINIDFNIDLLKSNDFNNWDQNKKVIFLLVMFYNRPRKLTKQEYIDLTKNWSPDLKAIAFKFIDTKDIPNITIEDLEILGGEEKILFPKSDFVFVTSNTVNKKIFYI